MLSFCYKADNKIMCPCLIYGLIRAQSYIIEEGLTPIADSQTPSPFKEVMSFLGAKVGKNEYFPKDKAWLPVFPYCSSPSSQVMFQLAAAFICQYDFVEQFLLSFRKYFSLHSQENH